MKWFKMQLCIYASVGHFSSKQVNYIYNYLASRVRNGFRSKLLLNWIINWIHWLWCSLGIVPMPVFTHNNLILKFGLKKKNHFLSFKHSFIHSASVITLSWAESHWNQSLSHYHWAQGEGIHSRWNPSPSQDTTHSPLIPVCNLS